MADGTPEPTHDTGDQPTGTNIGTQGPNLISDRPGGMANPASAVRRRISIPAILATLLYFATTSRAFLSIPYNTTDYFGPDGPWQAVSLGLKYPADEDYSPVNVYPSNLYNTIAALYVPTSQACQNDTTGSCAAGGTVNSLAYTNGSSWYTYLNEKTGYYFYYNGSTAYMDALLPQGIVASGTIVDVCKIAEVTYPNGNTVPAEVGLMGLGGSPLARKYNPPLAVYQDDVTQSNTYGLHIGSAQFKYPGSLILGGYDRGRVIGPVLSFDAHSQLGLLDIMIGVEAGGSPFPFESKQNLLKAPESAGVTQPIESYLKPEYPYIYLPQQSIQAITENLPVKFDSSAGYWLWETSDPSYKKIVGGAGYLGFTFPSLTGNTANETIKVPFALLNLTLESSISGLDSDVPYFPIMEARISQVDGYPILLGRAFMQATFTGTNWGTNVSWLAQAPGPGANKEGLGYDPVDITDVTQTLDVPSGDDLFRQSWEGHWTVLRTDSELNAIGSGNGNGKDDNDDSGLSSGAIAGIVVGVVALLAIIAAIIFLLLRRRKRNATAAATAPAPPGYHDDKQGPAPTYAHYDGEAQSPPVSELYGAYKPVPQREQWHEVDGMSYHAELPGNAPQELPAK
ncbi:uncharacterized protein LTR77_007458 [Saxophila tyrrhenica]|uniref:Peptidase A1 domain-containing protein n=1 Tax=Saxophila tyrrhenica TaxID=1690608 RepID=A0AAV9P4L7_9PEZI|nr:hypothetical protein LTR77_007458 [Saxophila tyrrhenica]